VPTLPALSGGSDTAEAGTQGDGGAGSGTGSAKGAGAGSGFTPARQIGGRFRNSDFPQSARDAGQRLRIGVRYAVGPSGNVDHCEIIDSSGYAEVDAMTCRVITERYRFKPARDPDGYPVTQVMEEDYSWRMDWR
jgi:protein TonB